MCRETQARRLELLVKEIRSAGPNGVTMEGMEIKVGLSVPEVAHDTINAVK